MSLADIGTNESRTGAMPNTHDAMSERKADGTTSWSQQVNSIAKPRIVTKDARIVGYDANNTARIFIGLVPELSNQPVIAISVDGVDVLTALGTT